MILVQRGGVTDMAVRVEEIAESLVLVADNEDMFVIAQVTNKCEGSRRAIAIFSLSLSEIDYYSVWIVGYIEAS
jgi:hypothetical protein